MILWLVGRGSAQHDKLYERVEALGRLRKLNLEEINVGKYFNSDVRSLRNKVTQRVGVWGGSIGF